MENNLYSCEKCKYSSNNITNYNLHLKTKKHNSTQDKDKKFVCNVCNKHFAFNQGLWVHNKKCKEDIVDLRNENEKLKQTIIDLLKKQSIDPVINNINNTITNNSIKIYLHTIICNNINNTITNNSMKINLNIFLNDQCKNAVNMIDFVKTIVFDLKDFENIQDTGYIQNKTNVILENLNKLTIFERPIHYINKEDSIHIRDNDQWKMENSLEKPIFDTAMKELENTEYDDLYKTIKVSGVSHRGKPTTDYDINKFPQFTEVKGLLDESSLDTNNVIISNVLNNVGIETDALRRLSLRDSLTSRPEDESPMNEYIPIN